MTSKLDIMKRTGDRWELINDKPEKVIPEASFEKRVDNIKGIGDKTLKDILILYKTKEELIDGLQKNIIPLRDDIVRKLKEEFL